MKNYIRARKFLRAITNRNFWIFMFFLVLSASFWLFLTLGEEYDVEVSVPVKMTNVPEGVTITTPPPSEVKIKLHDNGGSLLAYRHGGLLGTISIDFGDYEQQSGHVSLLTSNVARDVLKRLRSGTKVMGYSPDTLHYYYNHGENRRVPVVLQADIKTSELFTLTDTTLSHRYVTVYASQSTLDTLTSIHTKLFVLPDVHDKQTVTAALQSIPGVKMVPDHIEVTFDVDRMTENSVQVPVEYINFPAGKTLRTFPGIVEVIYQAGMKRYKDISAEDFAIVVSYDQVTDSTNTLGNKLTLTLKSKPDDVTHVRIKPEQVEFLIEDSGEN